MHKGSSRWSKTICPRASNGCPTYVNLTRAGAVAVNANYPGGPGGGYIRPKGFYSYKYPLKILNGLVRYYKNFRNKRSEFLYFILYGYSGNVFIYDNVKWAKWLEFKELFGSEIIILYYDFYVLIISFSYTVTLRVIAIIRIGNKCSGLIGRKIVNNFERVPGIKNNAIDLDIGLICTFAYTN
ncbi:hypothetical protein B0T20DRAFT_391529 [Sordaria brevicollis]|uniref:Uncharacterized protein n=1 Tax=Sordaria brevicollis TaxID=83679 RepID=A0AAE0UDC2_SORBR|nr:hypothetical protein B0T20DRAFT_391529 [Sordaria brevicollis]